MSELRHPVLAAIAYPMNILGVPLKTCGVIFLGWVVGMIFGRTYLGSSGIIVASVIATAAMMVVRIQFLRDPHIEKTWAALFRLRFRRRANAVPFPGRLYG